MAEKKRIVVALSQEGYNVETAGDENMVWSSDWRSVHYGQEFIFDIANQQIAQNYDHNLGKAVAFFVYRVGTATSEPEVNNSLFMTTTQLKWVPNGGEPAAPLKLKVFITDIDLKKNYLAPVFSTGGSPTTINRRYVIALSRKGKSVHSTDLRDFVFHSYCRSPLLHQVSNGVAAPVSGAGVNGVDAVHGLPYVPMNFCYKNTADGWMQLSGIGGGEGVFILSDRVRYGNTALGAEATVIVFKDPFNLGLTASVVQ